MNKEQEIEELAKELEKGKDYPYINTPKEMAERLVTVGYGNIEKFVIELKKNIPNGVISGGYARSIVDMTLKEFRNK